MILYFSFIFFIILVNVPSLIFKKKKVKIICATISTIFLICILTFKSHSVGHDTQNYIESYGKPNGFEIGYRILSYTFYNLGLDFRFLQLFCYTITIIPISLYFYFYSENLSFSYLLLFGFNIFTFFESGLRQTVAIGLITLSYISLKKNHTFLFLIFVAFAFLFHKTALFFIITIFFRRRKLNVKYLTIILAISLAIFIIGPKLYNVVYSLLQKGSYMPEDNDGGFFYLTTFIMVIVCFLIESSFFKKHFENNPFLRKNKSKNKMLDLYCVVFYSLFYATNSFSEIFSRVSLFYNIMVCAVLSNIISSFENKKTRAVLYSIASFLFILFYWYTSLRNNYLNILPYSIF